MPATATPMPFDRNCDVETVQDDRSDILLSIRKPFVTLALWHRPLPPSVDNWLRSLSPDKLPRGRILAHKTEFGLALDEMLYSSGTPRSREASLFAEDAVNISALFADIAGTELVDINMSVIEHDSCWKFHRDQVKLRILTTYLGPGTQYVDDKEADRALEEQSAFGGTVHAVPRHTIAIFKGARDAFGKGVVHRSPPIAGTGQTRLVLTLNLPSAVSPEYRVLGRDRNRDASAWNELQ